VAEQDSHATRLVCPPTHVELAETMHRPCPVLFVLRCHLLRLRARGAGTSIRSGELEPVMSSAIASQETNGARESALSVVAVVEREWEKRV